MRQYISTAWERIGGFLRHQPVPINIQIDVREKCINDAPKPRQKNTLPRIMKGICRGCAIALGAVAAASLTGWFSASDLLTRSISFNAMLWMGMSAALSFFMHVYVSSFMKNDNLQSSSYVIVSFIITMYSMIGTVFTFFAFYLALDKFQTAPFKKNIPPSAYTYEVSKVFEAAGAPFTIINWPKTLIYGQEAKREAQINNDLLDYAGDHCMHSIGNPEKMEDLPQHFGKAGMVAGSVMSFADDSITISHDQHAYNLKLRGISVEDDQKHLGARELAATYNQLSKANGKRLPEIECVQLDASSPKWICHLDSYDLGKSLIFKGVATPNLQELKGISLETSYLLAQLNAQLNGCGIWGRKEQNDGG